MRNNDPNAFPAFVTFSVLSLFRSFYSSHTLWFSNRHTRTIHTIMYILFVQTFYFFFFHTSFRFVMRIRTG